MQRLGIGIIGSGFMGRAHAHAFRCVNGLFPLALQAELEMLADIDEKTAEQAARALGFNRASGDWQTLVSDPIIDVVTITTPNTLHKPMALAAIEQQKTVYCEKPLASTLADAKVMCEAAETAGVITLVGFNYLHNPLVRLAREIIAGGEIGEITGFRGIHAEDYMADPNAPYNWRCEPEGGGVSADLGSHIIAMARYLIGDIEAVCGHMNTVYKNRPAAAGSQQQRRVEIDDQAHFLVQFTNGVSGSICASWIASGRKMQLDFEVTGSKGALVFTQERFNELKLYTGGPSKGRDGFKTIVAGPEHPDYAAFCPAPGHQLGFNDLKVIEVKTLLEALAGDGKAFPDFREAWQVARVVEAVTRSSQGRSWVAISEI
jgi:predicted dehydrogenase